MNFSNQQAHGANRAGQKPIKRVIRGNSLSSFIMKNERPKKKQKVDGKRKRKRKCVLKASDGLEPEINTENPNFASSKWLTTMLTGSVVS